MNEELMNRAMELYKAPFQFWVNSGIVVDRNATLVCENTFGERGELIAKALNEYWRSHGK